MMMYVHCCTYIVYLPDRQDYPIIGSVATDSLHHCSGYKLAQLMMGLYFETGNECTKSMSKATNELIRQLTRPEVSLKFLVKVNACKQDTRREGTTLQKKCKHTSGFNSKIQTWGHLSVPIKASNCHSVRA